MNYDELISINIVPEEISKSLYEMRETGISHTPYKDEIRLFSCIKQGDINKLINELKQHTGSGIFVGQMSSSNIMQHKYMAVSCITLATRYAIQGGMNEFDAYSFSDDFIRTIDTLPDSKYVMDYMVQKIFELTKLVNEASHKLKYSPHIRKCLAYINKNLHKKITVSELAEECGLSADYISHIFKKEMNENLSSYILRKKLEAAKTFLWEGFDNSKICYTLGFCSQSHFISSFKKEFGITPSEYAALAK